ncbi:MAG: ribosome biogenesis GTPase YlqF [Eubacterium sp.]|nr:ribosome biogenesis GTPase YlqF [Eubacterium sp.]MBP3719528.1 ribosome biogenesis GTPase YlqF [Eubacterium sp.]
MDINWYPGHMTSARRKIEQDIKLCDIIIELLDARIPRSSKNPDIDTLVGSKKRLIIMNKSDLADRCITDAWKRYYEEAGIKTLAMDCRNRRETLRVTDAVREVCKDKIERDRRRGIMNRPVKAMIAGIPNVGKSTFINSFVGKVTAKTGNKPGVTKGNQWIRLSKDMNLLDTPGILWPKFEDTQTGLNLAYIGSINDNILNLTEISENLIAYLKDNYCNILQGRYMIDEARTSSEILYDIAINKKCLLKGGEPDIDRAAFLLLDDLRAGRLGRISLEKPEE